MLIASAVMKYFLESNEAKWGHMRQTMQEVYWTKKIGKEQEMLMVYLPQTQVQEISINIKYMKHIMYNDQTEQFSVVSNQWNRYIMVLCKTDGNLILLEPIKKQNIGRNVQGIWETNAMDEPKWNQNFKTHSQQWSIRLIPKNNKPTWHWVPKSPLQNASLTQNWKKISTFKDHFKAILSLVDKTFPMHLWDRLLPQTEHILNMLWPTNISSSPTTPHHKRPAAYHGRELLWLGRDEHFWNMHTFANTKNTKRHGHTPMAMD